MAGGGGGEASTSIRDAWEDFCSGWPPIANGPSDHPDIGEPAHPFSGIGKPEPFQGELSISSR